MQSISQMSESTRKETYILHGLKLEALSVESLHTCDFWKLHVQNGPNVLCSLHKILNRPLGDGSNCHEDINEFITHEVKHLIQLHFALIFVIGGLGKVSALKYRSFS